MSNSGGSIAQSELSRALAAHGPARIEGLVNLSQKRPNFAPVWVALAEEHLRARRTEEAVQAARRALRLEPTIHTSFSGDLAHVTDDLVVKREETKIPDELSASALAVTAKPKKKLGRVALTGPGDRALKEAQTLSGYKRREKLEELVIEYPDHAQTWLALAEETLAQRSVDKAMIAVERATDLDPSLEAMLSPPLARAWKFHRVESRIASAQARPQSGEGGGARANRKPYQKAGAASAEPQEPEEPARPKPKLDKMLATAMSLRSRKERINILEQLIVMDSSNIEVLFQLAKELAMDGRADDARKRGDELRKLTPERYTELYQWAAEYYADPNKVKESENRKMETARRRSEAAPHARSSATSMPRPGDSKPSVATRSPALVRPTPARGSQPVLGRPPQPTPARRPQLTPARGATPVTSRPSIRGMGTGTANRPSHGPAGASPSGAQPMGQAHPGPARGGHGQPDRPMEPGRPAARRPDAVAAPSRPQDPHQDPHRSPAGLALPPRPRRPMGPVDEEAETTVQFDKVREFQDARRRAASAEGSRSSQPQYGEENEDLKTMVVNVNQVQRRAGDVRGPEQQPGRGQSSGRGQPSGHAPMYLDDGDSTEVASRPPVHAPSGPSMRAPHPAERGARGGTGGARISHRHVIPRNPSHDGDDDDDEDTHVERRGPAKQAQPQPQMRPQHAAQPQPQMRSQRPAEPIAAVSSPPPYTSSVPKKSSRTVIQRRPPKHIEDHSHTQQANIGDITADQSTTMPPWLDSPRPWAASEQGHPETASPNPHSAARTRSGHDPRTRRARSQNAHPRLVRRPSSGRGPGSNDRS